MGEYIDTQHWVGNFQYIIVNSVIVNIMLMTVVFIKIVLIYTIYIRIICCFYYVSAGLLIWVIHRVGRLFSFHLSCLVHMLLSTVRLLFAPFH